MKKLPLFLILGVLAVGCGSGSGLPSGDQTINISTSQNQDNNQQVNEPELECNYACTTEKDGGSNLTSTCKGGATEVLAAFATFNECAAEIQQTTAETSGVLG